MQLLPRSSVTESDNNNPNYIQPKIASTLSPSWTKAVWDLLSVRPDRSREGLLEMFLELLRPYFVLDIYLFHSWMKEGILLSHNCQIIYSSKKPLYNKIAYAFSKVSC